MPRIHSARSSERLVRCSDHMTAMDKKREARQHCQQAAQLIVAKADVTTIERALELALLRGPPTHGGPGKMKASD